MQSSSRFLTLAVAFLGMGFAAACTNQSQTVAADGSSAPEIAESDTTPETPSETTVTPITPSETPTEEAPQDIQGIEESPEGTENPEDEAPAPTEEPNDEPPAKDSIDLGKIRVPSGVLPGDLSDTQGLRPETLVRVPGSFFPDITAPEFQNVGHSGDGEKFTIVFTEPVSVASVKTAFSFEVFAPLLARFEPVEGTITSTNGQASAKFVRFTADEPVVDLDPTHVSGITFFRIRIAGADSADASLAVKDAAGNAMAHEVLLTGTCREMPADAPYQVDCK